MPLYTVQVFRETRFQFEGIEADTPKEAAPVAGNLHSDDCSEWEATEGDNLYALIEVVGDSQGDGSRFVDAWDNRVRLSAHELRDALKVLYDACSKLPDGLPGESYSGIMQQAATLLERVGAIPQPAV